MESTDNKTILLVEDDTELARLTQNYLENNGYKVSIINDGKHAVKAVIDNQPELLILDLMLPNKDGLDICREVRNDFHNPILMLTAKSDDLDQILGLEMGADDYISKPVEPRVLLARVKTLLRRKSLYSTENKKVDTLNFSDLKINKRSRSVKLNEKDVALNAQEFDLLWYLASQAGNVLSRDDIFINVRKLEYDGVSRFVDVTISHLRHKLGDDPVKPRRIKTIFGKGYLFSDEAL